MFQKQRYLFLTLPKRRNLHGEAAQAVVEVLAEHLRRYRLFDVYVRCRQNSDVGSGGGAAAQSGKAVIL